MKDTIDRLRQKLGLAITEGNECWEIRVIRPENIAFEIVIPRTGHEWFVTAKAVETGKELWSDWMDYYGEREINLEMESDVEWFVERLLASTVRVVESKTFLGRRLKVEWRAGGDWERISLYRDES
jgi:hypothetical protein